MGCIHADGGSPNSVCGPCAQDDARAAEIAMIKKGSRVVELGDEWYVGEVVAREGKKVKVYWENGTGGESWLPRSSLRLIAPLRAYPFTYPGVALGGECVVIAASALQALKGATDIHLKAEFDKQKSPIDIWPKATVVVHNWNGDY